MHALMFIVTIAIATCILPIGAEGSSKEKVIYSFTNGSDGYLPHSPLVMDEAGNLYGEAYGGIGGYGVVFKLEPRSTGYWNETTYYAFGDGGIHGASPAGGLLMETTGTFYGITTGGGSGNSGTVFELPAAFLTNPAIYNFVGADSTQGLARDKAGNLYGTTSQGGTSDTGTVFDLVLTDSGWNYEVIYNFGQTDGTDGIYPAGRLVTDGAGDLYGTTLEGGVYGAGTVFELINTPNGWSESVLYNFTGGDNGSTPLAGVIFDGKGNLYGTTLIGGADDAGTVFRLTPSHDYWNFRVIYSFTGGKDGGAPYYGSLVSDNVGNLFGTTWLGGPLQFGTVFQLTQEKPGKWKETVLHSFKGGSDGKNPIYGVILDSAGNLYGTTPSGGADGWGVVFECVR